MRFFERVAELERDRVPFALALVVSRRAPVSSHVGDRAVVFADGRMEGFVGGSCSRDIVRRHGVEALRTGTPRLLHISPVTPSLSRGDAKHDPASADAPGAEHIFVPMSCASEGAADVYLEPHLPSRRLIVAGFTPVAQALARVGSALDYEVLRVVDDRGIAQPAAFHKVKRSGVVEVSERFTRPGDIIEKLEDRGALRADFADMRTKKFPAIVIDLLDLRIVNFQKRDVA